MRAYRGTELIRNAFGAYQFRLPRYGWVDAEAAVLAVHLAEAALKGGDLDGAAGHAFVARLITARPFLPGVEGIWADEWRRKLQELRIRAVECMADVCRLRVPAPPTANFSDKSRDPAENDAPAVPSLRDGLCLSL